jgi:hypothetical protein
MAGVDVIWARAPTLDKLQAELAGLLDHYAPEDLLGMSHSAAATSSKQSGGVWGGGRQSQELEYSAVVLVRKS